MDELTMLHRYLDEARTALRWKLDGVGERDARTPRTPTGLSLAGLVLHAANTQLGYFGPVFGRPFTGDAALDTDALLATDPQADFVLPAEHDLTELLDFWDATCALADGTIRELGSSAAGLDSTGRVPGGATAR